MTLRDRRRARQLCGFLALVWLALLAIPARAEAQLGALLSPGRLAKAHEALEGITNCQKCHEQGRKVVAEKCLSCHAPIANRMAKKIGVHRNVTECVTCHAEHAGVDGELRPFDRKKFDHATVTGFPLTGKHTMTGAECAACHTARSFLTLTATCVSCHAEPKMHLGKFGTDCARCHATADWHIASPATALAGGKFDHNLTAFKLTGKHKIGRAHV